MLCCVVLVVWFDRQDALGACIGKQHQSELPQSGGFGHRRQVHRSHTLHNIGEWALAVVVVWAVLVRCTDCLDCDYGVWLHCSR